MPEHEVTDSEGVFSRRLLGNWAELPRTLRKRHKHRPELLSQFTDLSESECDYRPGRPDSCLGNGKRVFERSELLGRLDRDRDARGPTIYTNNNNNNNNSNGQQPRSLPTYAGRTTGVGLADYRLRYEARGDARTRPRAPSDDERKSNSPDSLLVRSSESESSLSDEYGHTDDSGAFLEKASSFERFEQRQPQSLPLRHRFAKLFGRPAGQLDDNSSPGNKNGLSHAHQRRSAQGETNGNGRSRFEYDNIPRIDATRLGPWANSPEQPTIEQLRAEEGCQLRNRRNSAHLSTRSTLPERPRDSEEVTRLEGLIKEANSRAGTLREDKDSKLSVREILKRFEELRARNEPRPGQADNGGDRTLNTIQETLKKLDEKVKSYQVLFNYLFLGGGIKISFVELPSSGSFSPAFFA